LLSEYHVSVRDDRAALVPEFPLVPTSTESATTLVEFEERDKILHDTYIDG
jgi:hypothetical protein